MCSCAGTDSALWHKWYDGRLERLGEPRRRADLRAGRVLVGAGPARRVRARHRQRALAHVVRRTAGAAGRASAACSPRARPRCRGAPDRIDVFAAGTDSALWHKWYDDGWSDWESLGGVLTRRPRGRRGPPDRLDVFVRRHRQRAVAQVVRQRLERLGEPRRRSRQRAGGRSWGPDRIDVFVRRHRQRAAGTAGGTGPTGDPFVRRDVWGLEGRTRSTRSRWPTPTRSR